MRKYILLIILLAGLEVSLALFLTFWREDFWQAVANKQGADFIHQLIVFSVAAIGICFISGLSGYFVSLATIKWREKLNKKGLTCASSNVENIGQRVQEDCLSFPDLVLNLSIGAFKSTMYILVFSVSLVISFGYKYLAVLVAYMCVGAFITKFVAQPLIKLNYDQQRAEASYRQSLNIVNFGDCVRIMLGLAKRQKHLTYFQQFYNQVGVVIPLIIIAPLYFTTGMTLGSLMRFNSLSSTTLDNLSYGVNSFALINKLLSCRRRLKEAGII